MRTRVIIGAFVAALLLGVGVLAGSIIGTGSVAAQTPTQSATPAPSAPKGDGTPAPSNPGNRGNQNFPGKGGGHGPGGFGPPPGARGGFGPGSGDHGHNGFGAPGTANANANMVTREISSTTNLIAQVKSDLAYATGKMDTSNVQKWVDGADALLKSAQDANSGSRYGSAIAFARAASELANVAETQMAQKLGANNLPSYNQRPQFRRPGPGGNGNRNSNGSSSTTVTQVEASRLLANTYNQLVAQGAMIKNASNAGDAATYLTDAQNAYTSAYNSYQLGNYSDAVASGRIAQELAGVASAVLQAANASNGATTPVTVPAPNF